MNYASPSVELGVCLPINEIIGRSSKAAIGLLGLVAYPAGLKFRFAAAWNDPDLVEEANRPWMAFHGDPEQVLKLGLRYADGSVFTNLDRHFSQTVGLPSGLRQDITWWVPAIPPDGAVEVFCEWLVAGIGTSRLELEGEPIRQASAIPSVRWALPT